MKTTPEPHHVRIRIIIPAYRDRTAVQEATTRLLEQNWTPDELCVVISESDGTETDMAEKRINCLKSEIGRSRQMNTGAQAMDCDLLVFLHADTRLPDTARSSLQTAFTEGALGGGFSRRFDSPSPFLKFTCVLADLRGRLFGWYFGDQTIWCRKKAFDKLGGFPDLPLFEDLEFSQKLHRHGPTRLLPGPSISSARRFQKGGPLKRTWKDLKLTWKYVCMSPPNGSK